MLCTHRKPRLQVHVDQEEQEGAANEPVAEAAEDSQPALVEQEEEEVGGICATRRQSNFCYNGRRTCCCKNNGLWASCGCSAHIASRGCRYGLMEEEQEAANE